MMNNFNTTTISGIISILSVAIPAAIAALAAYYSAKKTSENTFKYNIELNKNKLKYQIYGELIGRKYLMSQLYVLYFLSVIQSQNSRRLLEFFNKKINLNSETDKCDAESFKTDEAKSHLLMVKNNILEDNRRASIRSEELLIELAKSNELFWRTIGQIKILFEDDTVNALIKKLENFEKEIENFEDKLKNNSKININYNLKNGLDKLASEWSRENESKLKKYIEKYNNILDELLTKLGQLIN